MAELFGFSEQCLRHADQKLPGPPSEFRNIIFILLFWTQTNIDLSLSVVC